MGYQSMGMSDAEFTVWKRGTGCAEQGKYIQHLGPHVAPYVSSVSEHGYEMELLHPHQHDDTDLTWTLQKICALLVEHVWPLPPVSPPDHTWDQQMAAWMHAHGASYLVPHLSACYATVTLAGYVRIHGDPTVANLMLRRNGQTTEAQPILVDPLPPKGKVPSRIEVDVGKMLQSALGWEHAVRTDLVPARGTRCAQTAFLGAFSQDVRRRGWLWCAIHLQRAAPYCRARGRWKLATWAEDTARHVEATELR